MQGQLTTLPAGTAPASSVGKQRRFTLGSGQRLLLLFAGTSLIALLVQGAIALVVGLQISSQFHTIGTDTAPAIVAAQNLRSGVQEMDTDLTNVLVQFGLTAPNKEDWRGNRAQATKVVLGDIAQAQARLTFAGQCEAVTALRDGIADYSTYAAQAEQAERVAGAALTGGAASANLPLEVVTLYNLAADVVLNRIDPALVAGAEGESAVPATARTPIHACTDTVRPAVSNLGGLYTVTTKHEQSSYDSGHRLIVVGTVLAVVTGLLSLAAIVLTSLTLAQSTHRLINLGLALGGLIALAILIGEVVQLASLNGRLNTAHSDSLASVRTALELKSTAQGANADESRWLFATNRVMRWQDDFTAAQKRVDGLIQRATANVTYSGEREAIAGNGSNGARPVTAGCSSGIQPAWTRYLGVDKQLRTLQNSNQHAAAVALALGDSNTAFSDVIACADELQRINAVQFDRATSSGERTALVVAIAGIAAGVVGAVVIILGVRPRFAVL